MSDNRQMSVAMQRLVDLISMVTNSTLLRNNTVTLSRRGHQCGVVVDDVQRHSRTNI
jgi:hypothetical protein